MTVSGMTGFARASGAAGTWSWAVEARSVNGRNLEVRFRAPPGFEGVERAARDAAQARFQRGQLHVGVQARRAEAGGKAQVDVEALERLIALSRPYVDAGSVARPGFDGLLSVRGVMVEADEGEDTEAREALEASVAATVIEALDGLKAARLEEGRALAPVLHGMLGQIESLVETAAGLAATQPEALKERFARKIADLAGPAAELQERIVQEAALLAVKADVREELDRLTAHVASARGLLAANAPAGRRLDFLSQEFMREANTLCSKSAATALTAAGLELKAVIEQFREQVQNVE
jgi:uncharacterized protein (TIGR00255 family)